MPDCLHAFQTAAREALSNQSHVAGVELVACLFNAGALARAPRPKTPRTKRTDLGPTTQPAQSRWCRTYRG